MNKIGKMGRRSKIPGQRMEIQKGLQEKPKKWSELSTEGKKKFKATVSKYYERYVNSNKDGKESIISNILGSNGLDFIDINNRRKVSNIMSLEKQRRERMGIEGTRTPTEGPKHRDRLSDTKKEEIKKIIIKKNWHTLYLYADAIGDRSKKSDIAKQVLDELGIKDYSEKNRRMAQRLIVSTTFKPWIEGGEEEKALTNWLYDDINATVWDKEITKQAREEIMDKFKKQFPANEHNDYDITNKISSIVNYIKRTKQRPVRVKPKKSRSIETEQIKPVQQATFQVIKKQIQFDNVIGRIENNYNDLFSRINSQNTEITPKTTNSVKVYLEYSIDPFALEDLSYDVDSNDLKTCHDFGDLENSYSL